MMNSAYRLSRLALLLLLVASFGFTACDDDDDNGGDSPDQLEVPKNYDDFKPDMTFQGQIERRNMLSELTAEVKKANDGTDVDAQTLKNLYTNANSPFADAELNSSDRQLKNKTYDDDVQSIFLGSNLATPETFEAYLDSLATISQKVGAGDIAANGKAGIANGEWLHAANGVEYAQLIEKGLMGAVFYWQATGFYLTDAEIGDDVDNGDQSFTAGKGTDMEHHWDEAFGYLGLPNDYVEDPTLLSSEDRHWAKYSHDREDLLGSATGAMNAFLKGRAAISAGDMATKNEARDEARTEWEKTVAGTAIHYFNNALEDTDNGDMAARNHHFSEGIAFTYSLFYNPARTITEQEILDVLKDINETVNLYEVTRPEIVEARDKLADIYGITDPVKSDL